MLDRDHGAGYRRTNIDLGLKLPGQGLNYARSKTCADDRRVSRHADAIVADFVGRYETLEADFANVLARIGLTGKVELPKVNVSKRRGSEGGGESYREAYGTADRELVATWYAREIAHFGYRF